MDAQAEPVWECRGQYRTFRNTRRA